MRSLNVKELELWCESASSLLGGAQLQDVWFDGRFCFLEFYRFQEIYLVTDLSQQTPRVWISQTHPPKKKQTKPFVLFANAHFKNRYLAEIILQKDWGRIIELRFFVRDSSESCTLQIRLIPKAVNVILEANEKKISLEKIRPLVRIEQQSFQVEEGFTFEKWNNSQEYDSIKMNHGRDLQLDRSTKAIEKKKQAIEKIELSLASSERQELIAQGQESLARGEVHQAHLLFEKAKQLAVKKENQKQALLKLKKELDRLEERPVDTVTTIKPNALSEKPKVKVRQMVMDEGKVFQYGKSAEENLKLLRMAKAWHLWVHLRNEPGSYGILARHKDQRVGDHELRECILWMLKSQHKYSRWQGGQVEVLVAECRFVRPIKGAKAGLVNYSNERVLGVDCP